VRCDVVLSADDLLTADSYAHRALASAHIV
jgi:hypothetical protein